MKLAANQRLKGPKCHLYACTQKCQKDIQHIISFPAAHTKTLTNYPLGSLLRDVLSILFYFSTLLRVQVKTGKDTGYYFSRASNVALGLVTLVAWPVGPRL